jgi:glycosyltransferase involved in cell wall biosynthesis
MGDAYFEKKHVLQIIGEPVGGIRKHVHALLFGLSRTEIKQSYSYSILNTDPIFEDELPKIQEILQNRLLPLKIGKRPNLLDCVNILRLIKYVKKNKVTIVHGHGAKGGAYARMLKKFCGVKAIYTPHGGFVHKMFNPVEEFLYSSVEKYLSKYTDFFVFESKYSAEAYFEKIGQIEKSRWIINYSGITIPDIKKITKEAKSLKYPKDNFKIGVFGILRAQKGQVYAVEALSELLKQNVNIELHLFGDGPDRKKLENNAKELGVDKNIYFHGMIDNIYPHMYCMDIVLIPSLFESFGYVALEAFALKKPIIASNVGGLKEIIMNGEDGISVNIKNISEIVDAIKYYIENPKTMVEFADNGYSRVVSEFDECKMIEKLNKIYSSKMV